jgi:hypothetical protein
MAQIGSGMLQVHKEPGSPCLVIVSFPLHFPGSFFLPRTALTSSLTSLGGALKAWFATGMNVTDSV